MAYNSEIQRILDELSGLRAPSLSDSERSGFLARSRSLFEPTRLAATNRFNANRQGIAKDFTDLETRLREGAVNSTKSLEESLNSRGLLQSGTNAAGQGKIQTNLSGDISRAAIDRAIKEADLALEQTNFETGLEGQILSQADQFGNELLSQRGAELELKRGSLTSRLDALQKLMSLDASRSAAASSAAASKLLSDKIAAAIAAKGGGAGAGAGGLNASNAPSLKDMSTIDRVKFFRGLGYDNKGVNDLVTGLSSALAGDRYQSENPEINSTLEQILGFLDIDIEGLNKPGKPRFTPAKYERGKLFSQFLPRRR